MTAKALASALRGYAQQAWDAVPAQDDVLRGFGPPEDVAEIVKAFIPQPQNIVPGLQHLGQGMLSGDLNKLVGGGALALGGAIDMVPGGRAVKSGAMALGKALGKALGRGPIRGYHSSPHDFDEFNSSKIGTGEGAQAYGHGHYIAENPAVSGQGGEYYRHFTERLQASAKPFLEKHGGDVAAAEATTRAEIKRLLAIPNAGNSPERLESLLETQRTRLSALDTFKRTGEFPKARTYEVNIHSDPNKFLDWDKRLFEQQGVVDAMYLPLTDMMSRRDVNRLLGDRNTGEHLFRNTVPAPYSGVKYLNDLAAVGPQKKGAFAYSPHQIRDARSRLKDRADLANISPESVLQKAGIPGIRYLDGGSRAAGKGSSNYVVFDPKTIEIIRKYGIAGLLGGAGAAASQGADNAGGGI